MPPHTVRRGSACRAVASQAFCTRFITTCCNWPDEPQQRRSGGRSMRTANLAEALCTTQRTERLTTSFKLTCFGRRLVHGRNA